VPELPEVEIAVRRIDRALKGAEVESALAPGMVALKSVKPPLESIAGLTIHGVRRVGKMPVVELGHGGEPELALLVHMMSAGRLQVFDERASLRDRRSRCSSASPTAGSCGCASSGPSSAPGRS
jgi:formamidopyrimidine-DNA glycosylase